MRLTPIGMVEGDVKMRSQRDEMEASMKTQTPHEQGWKGKCVRSLLHWDGDPYI